MNMGSSGAAAMPGMHQALTSQYLGYPVLFKTLTANDSGECFGIFVLLMAIAFAARGLEFIGKYLEVKVWSKVDEPEWNHPPITTSYHPERNTEESVSSTALKYEDDEVIMAKTAVVHRLTPLWMQRMLRDGVRMGLMFVPEMLMYALMLVVMTYSLPYFFGVVVGLTLSRFVFDKLSMRLGMRPYLH